MKISPYLAEYIGTFFFLFVIIFTKEALPIGLALIIVILILGDYSGGHFNPAVTIMKWLNNDLPMNDAILYILSQVVGGASALFFYNRTK